MEHYQCAWTPESSGADALPAGPWVGHHFEECTFDGLDLTGFDLRKTRFENCTFRKCTLADVRLTSVRLHGVRFEHCALPSLRWSTLDTLVLDFTLVDCRAPMGDWGEMDLQGIQFKASDLSGGNFFKTDARKTEWTDCRLHDVVFDRRPEGRRLPGRDRLDHRSRREPVARRPLRCQRPDRPGPIPGHPARLTV